jgi:hypothetical protein
MEYIGWAVGQEMLEGTERVAQSLFERCLRILIVHELRALLCLACAFSSLMMSAVNFGLLNRPKPRVAGYSVFHMVAVALIFTGRGHKSLFQALCPIQLLGREDCPGVPMAPARGIHAIRRCVPLGELRRLTLAAGSPDTTPIRPIHLAVGGDVARCQPQNFGSSPCALSQH